MKNQLQESVTHLAAVAEGHGAPIEDVDRAVQGVRDAAERWLIDVTTLEAISNALAVLRRVPPSGEEAIDAPCQEMLRLGNGIVELLSARALDEDDDLGQSYLRKARG